MINTFKNKLVPDTAWIKTRSIAPPMYIGSVKGTIELIYWPRVPHRTFVDWIDGYTYADSADLEVLVDTTQFIGSTNLDIFDYPKPNLNIFIAYETAL